MDPIEKKFQEAFADYQFPVEDGLWDQVLEKKNRRKPFPWMRLAAAITLLLLAGALLWPEQGLEPAAIVETSTPMDTETENQVLPVVIPALKEPASIETELVIHPKAQAQKAMPVAATMEQSQPTPDEEIESTVHDLKVEFADLPQLNRKPLQRVHHTSAPVALPLPDVQWSATRATEPSELASAPTSKAQKRNQSDLTGPSRLVNVLERNSPKLVKDIIAFGSARSTEIEINW